MDLRSIKPGLAAVSHQYPLFMIHPRTGETLLPLGYAKRGNPIFPMMGGAPEEGEGDKDDDQDSDEDESEEDDDNEADDDDDESDDDDDDKSKSKGKKGGKDAKIKALEEEKDRHYKKYKNEKKRADDLESRLKALEEKDLKPEEREQRAKEQQDQRDREAAERVAKLNLENAFLKANEIEWVKPEQALAILLADPDEYEVEFDENGKVDRKSLRAELKRLAKANPHLVKPKAASKDDEGDDADKDGSAPRATASKMNGKRKGRGNAGLTREELAKKFPALGRMP